jgi:hypothetical protein
MGRGRHARRERRRRRAEVEAARRAERAAAAPSIPTAARTYRYLARSVELALGIDGEPVLGSGGPLEPQEARGLLFARALGKTSAGGTGDA